MVKDKRPLEETKTPGRGTGTYAIQKLDKHLLTDDDHNDEHDDDDDDGGDDDDCHY